MSILADASLSGHGAHTVTVLGIAALIGLLALVADARARLRKRGRQSPGPVMLAAAACSVGAASMHAIVSAGHFREGVVHGTFFAVATAAQLIWAWLTIHHLAQGWVLAAGLIGNLAIIALWLLTRTVGIPVGPGAGEVEALGVSDTITAAIEAAIVLCCAWTLSTRVQRRAEFLPRLPRFRSPSAVRQRSRSRR